MIIGPDDAETIRPQCGDGDRAGVVRVVLLGPARAHQPDPRCEHWWNVEHGFAGSHELLGDEVAEPVCGLNGPFAFVEAVRPFAQAVCLSYRCSKLELVDDVLIVVDSHRCVGGLVGVDTDHRHADCLPG